MEENQIVESILNKTFFPAWKNAAWKENKEMELFKTIEFMVSAHCDQACKYCYYRKYGKYTYPAAIAKPKLVIENARMILNWLEENEYYPEFNLFSGEIFAQKAGIEVIKLVSDFHKRTGHVSGCTIPTNMSFLFDEKKTEMVTKLINDGHEAGFHMHLSASVDGKYCDVNRPFKDKRIKTDEWYEKFFDFVAEHHVGLHPMVYSKEIQHWRKNFDWFQEHLAKRNLGWKQPYLLEVRNEEWTEPELNEFYKFIQYVVGYGWKKAKEEGVLPHSFPQYCHENKLFNLMTIFGSVGRGTSCSIQTTVQIRLGDMKHVLCHRAAYRPHELWKFTHADGKITGIEAINTAGFISWIAADSKTFPMCECCPINSFCIGQCWGSMFESNKDHFVPIPSVCALEHIKLKAVLDTVHKLNLHTYFYDHTNKLQKNYMKMHWQRYKGENL